VENPQPIKNKNWFLRHKVASAVLVVVVLGIVGAASSHPSVNTTPAKAGTASSSSTASKATTAHVGSAVNIGGSKGLAVTLTQVIDPATGADQYTTADAGKRFVGVALKIVNNGSSAYSDDANSNLTLIGSDNQSYTPDFSAISECTNFSNGQYTIAPGESTTGCDTFQVPNGVTTAKVQFTSESGFSGSTGEWLVP
jgi:hypothetical protein